MTSKEFVLWLKGFSEGVHEYNITPKQWDILKDKLAEVKDDNTSSPFPFGVPNSAPFVTLPHITPGPPTNPYNPYKITCTPGTTSPGFQVTTTPGTTGFITIANPNIASFGTGSTGILNTYNASTSTTYGYPSGSAWSYTNSTYKPPYTTGGEDEIIKSHNED
jgi:hypothetical protein